MSSTSEEFETIGIQYRYVKGERRTFVYHDPSRCKIVYYQGQKIWIWRDEPLKEHAEDISFVCFDDRESAEQVVKCLERRYGSFGFYTYASDNNKHLVSFNRFDGFLPQADPKFLACLDDPNSSSTCPGNPNVVLQEKIKQLINTLIYMHSKGVSSSLLHLPIGYVWRGPGLNIFMADSCKEDYTDAQWKKILARDVERFRIGLNKYFLKTRRSWPERDSFMRCFSMKLPDESMRLPMIRDHPFLQNSIVEILQIFMSVDVSLKSHRHGQRELTKLMAALHNSKQLKTEFMPNGVWTRRKMSTRIHRYLRGEPKGKSIKYNTKDMGDLLRFLRNMYDNGHEKGITWEYMFNKIRRYWPHLMDRFHEKIAGFSTRR